MFVFSFISELKCDDWCHGKELEITQTIVSLISEPELHISTMASILLLVSSVLWTYFQQLLELSKCRKCRNVENRDIELSIERYFGRWSYIWIRYLNTQCSLLFSLYLEYSSVNYRHNWRQNSARADFQSAN